MKQLRQYPIIAIFGLMLFVSLGCQASSILPASSANNDAVVTSAVATISAQENLTTVNAPARSGDVVTTDLENRFIEIYNRVNPAVVHIFVFDGDGLFLGTGSGFVVDSEGNIVTNNHVVADGSEYEVVFASGERSRASLQGADVDSDLAVIHVNSLPSGIQPVPLGDSSQLQVGQFVVAIGNPFGETGSMSIGVISGLGRTIESQRVVAGGTSPFPRSSRRMRLSILATPAGRCST